ncbi:helix-turn-helix transcriptional regulator [Sedimentitalea sp. HM32M-2]|uniref:helix-turn-helix transcriptional regulator n=1 Tax=Sedimentitalea sp. HM32M-2 TaxID=3351566 RepID=UPI00362A17B5
MSAVCLDVTGARVGLTSAATGDCPATNFDVEPETGALRSVELMDMSIEDSSLLINLSSLQDAYEATRHWQAYRCEFESGAVDMFAVISSETPEINAEFLAMIWPGLRRMCIQETCQSLSDLSDDAMLWMVSQKVNASILVLDQDCKVLKANAAGRDLMSEGVLVRNTPHGLACGREDESRLLRKAIAESSADGGHGTSEYVLILRGPTKAAHVPLSLSRYFEPKSGRQLFLAMLPMPPEQKRIEKLAIRLGLTPSEARVAALMRAGHSNRKAAEIAGLKIETFNTYAKRVLSKMNVTCRAEMAQMLTWQSAVERSL